MALAAMGTTIAVASWFFFPLISRHFPQLKILFNWSAAMTKTSSIARDHKPSAPLAQIIIPPAAGPEATTTKNAATPPPRPAIFNIQGIMTNNGSTVALINGKIYEQGDDIGGAKITNIGADTITISRNGTEETIPVRH